ncbi:WXG100 family type VII secretion target [Pseudonocardia sp. ICBG1293]|uniref:WXG100 family type VII secretion target n=1 Tax=Pseudonocardia sp. ICBG1293 TaxID=2844382 RepID=UPI001CCB7F0F|nr:hypothetical protein [Pseudonocardia sp. ICBG1293]
MADRFEIDEDEAIRAGERAGSAGDRLQKAHRNLASLLEARHGCWGTDDVGKAFDNSYSKYADPLRVNTEPLGENFSGVGEFTVNMAREFRKVDEDNADRIDGVYADNIEAWTEKD